MSVTSISNNRHGGRIRFSLNVNRAENCLEVEAVTRDGVNEDHLYRVQLMQLSPLETDLNGGRFARYDSTPHEHKILLKNDRIPMGGGKGPNLGEEAERMVDWVAAHTYSRWNVEYVFPHLASYEIIWTFKDSRDATLFKMTWG